MSYSSDQVDLAQVKRFKNALRPSLKFPASKGDLLALAEALEELAAEIRGEASSRRD